ncbi:MAG: T9SS type A sorting domain-containing protein [Psychroserpens sp.]|uniref:T9SS type A sorting domain-containing protein n=1 Tax=Psychroserpens sp. TaxID=2020870 RepID=UPI003001AC53
MFPNPAKDKVIMEMNASNFGNVIATVIDIQGKLILEKQISEGNRMHLDVSELQNGMYFVKVHTKDRSLVKKLIIE